MKNPKVLIVDDRPENLLTLQSLLDRPDLDIVSASSGMEALEQTLDHEFALVLLDVKMPGMDGYETAELMRGNKKTRNVPIIFVTAHEKERDQLFKGYDSGAVDYLFKPLEPAILLSKVKIFMALHNQKLQLKAKTRELDAKLVELEEVQQQLEESNEKLKRLSTLDGLTGIPNRRSFDERLETEWQRAIREQEDISLIMIDIDHFKPYNDHYGHVAGDVCLRQVSKLLTGSLHRDIDEAYRYGGEEFAVILPNTPPKGAVNVAKRIMLAFKDAAIEHPASDSGDHLTVSIGICSHIPKPGQKQDMLIEHTDKALYEAKDNGRNQFCTGKDFS